jgi:hypothetical protein
MQPRGRGAAESAPRARDDGHAAREVVRSAQLDAEIVKSLLVIHDS